MPVDRSISAIMILTSFTTVVSLLKRFAVTTNLILFKSTEFINWSLTAPFPATWLHKVVPELIIAWYVEPVSLKSFILSSKSIPVKSLCGVETLTLVAFFPVVSSKLPSLLIK